MSTIDFSILRKIKETEKLSYRIRSYPFKPSRPWKSKIGGMPFLPIEYDYPKDNDGAPLHLLAQINFSDIPTLSPFPRHGILQFYFKDDDCFGNNGSNTEQDDFRLIYIPEFEAGMKVHNLDNLPLPEEAPFDPREEFALGFSFERMPLTESDFRFERDFMSLFEDYKDMGEFRDAYSVISCGQSHRMGGYPFCVQGDPREGKAEDLDTLLLQLNSEDGISFGDGGSAQFFISEEALKNCDFSRVMYDWNCY